MYIVSHGGNLFTNSSAHAYPPPVPRIPIAVVAGGEEGDDATGTSGTSKVEGEEVPVHSKEDEVRRGARQILHSSGYVDMRDILLVRRAAPAFHPTAASGGLGASATAESIGDGEGDGLPLRGGGAEGGEGPVEDDDEGAQTRRERAGEDFPALDEGWEDDSDGEDVGGEGGLAVHRDRAALRLKRTFEVVMRSGSVVRFEVGLRSQYLEERVSDVLKFFSIRLTLSQMVRRNYVSCLQECLYSSHSAIDWVKRLNPLIRYWTRRHRVDARLEMDLVRGSQGSAPLFEVPRSSAQKHENFSGPTPPALPDPQAAAESMSAFWNWCVLEGCRPIVKAGKLFRKKERRKPYRYATLSRL